MSEYIPVTEFVIFPSVVFFCPLCGNMIESRKRGYAHISTSDHCSICNVRYLVDWDEQNLPTIKIDKPQESVTELLKNMKRGIISINEARRQLGLPATEE